MSHGTSELHELRMYNIYNTYNTYSGIYIKEIYLFNDPQSLIWLVLFFMVNLIIN